MWLSTVRGLTTSRAAMPRLLSPCRNSASTRASAAVISQAGQNMVGRASDVQGCHSCDTALDSDAQGGLPVGGGVGSGRCNGLWGGVAGLIIAQWILV